MKFVVSIQLIVQQLNIKKKIFAIVSHCEWFYLLASLLFISIQCINDSLPTSSVVFVGPLSSLPIMSVAACMHSSIYLSYFFHFHRPDLLRFHFENTVKNFCRIYFRRFLLLFYVLHTLLRSFFDPLSWQILLFGTEFTIAQLFFLLPIILYFLIFLYFLFRHKSDNPFVALAFRDFALSSLLLFSVPFLDPFIQIFHFPSFFFLLLLSQSIHLFRLPKVFVPNTSPHIFRPISRLCIFFPPLSFIAAYLAPLMGFLAPSFSFSFSFCLSLAIVLFNLYSHHSIFQTYALLPLSINSSS